MQLNTSSYVLAPWQASCNNLNEFHAHNCDNNRQISEVAGDLSDGLSYGYYRYLHGNDTGTCLRECCMSDWCDFVLVSDGNCYGIQCMDKKNCKSSRTHAGTSSTESEQDEERFRILEGMSVNILNYGWVRTVTREIKQCFKTFVSARF